MTKHASGDAPFWRSRSTGADALLPVVAVVVTWGLAVAYLAIAVQRVTYPFDLDLVEGGMMMQALRFASRQPVYIAPNADFVPQVYMPLYTWLAGLALRLTGPSYFPLRLMSLVATFATSALIYLACRHESGSRWLALTCAGVYLAGYRIVGGWFDLARVDSLYVALAMAGVATAVYCHRSSQGLAGAALLLSLAFLTKQQGLAVASLTGLYLALLMRWRAWLYGAVFGVTSLVAVAALQVASEGWFVTYTLGIAFASPLESSRLVRAVVLEIGGDMAVLMLMLVILWVVSLRRYRHRVLVEQPWLLLITASVLAAIAGRWSVGGARNQLMQAYAFLCLTPALLAREVTTRGRLPRRATSLLAAALLVQGLLTVAAPLARWTGHEPPQRYLPSAAMRTAGDRFLSRLASQEGDVLVMMHPFYAVLAGKAPHVHIQTLWHARWRGREPLPADLVSRIRTRSYAAIVSDDSEWFETDPELVSLIEAHYAPSQRLSDSDAPPTLSGIVVRPRRIFTPRRPARPDEPGAGLDPRPPTAGRGGAG